MCVFYPKTPQNYRSCKKIPASHFNKVGSAFWAKYVNYIITYGKNIPILMAIQVVIIQVFAESVKCGDMRWEIG